MCHCTSKSDPCSKPQTILTFIQGGAKAGLSAKDWSDSVIGVVGGKAGVKGTTAQGNGTETSKVDEALKAATEYLEKFKI